MAAILGHRATPMGIEFYIQSVGTDESHLLTQQMVLHIFQCDDVPNAHGFFAIVYDDQNACDLTCATQDHRVTDLCIHRPVDHPALYQSIFNLLKSGQYVLFAPGGMAPIVASPQTAALVPRDMSDALGAPVCVTNPDQIRPALFG